MSKIPVPKIVSTHTFFTKRSIGFVASGFVLCVVFVLSFFISQTLYYVKEEQKNISPQKTSIDDILREFPVGVNPTEKKIVENPYVDSFFTTHIGALPNDSKTHTSWVPKILGRLALMDWYQNLASLTSRILVIDPGDRKEQIAANFGKILKWSESEKQEFIDRITATAPEIPEGKFFPGTYTVLKNAKPEEVATLVHDRFELEVMTRYDARVENVVPIAETLIIASLIEREAYDFNDMRYISGVIWNRLFIDMRLQIDATLQYAKGGTGKGRWWPQVLPSDKYIASVYNTYAHEGLPPAPISNPSLDAILAALNPRITDCLYYFHDANSGFHCSVTYEEHVALLKEYYGRGK